MKKPDFRTFALSALMTAFAIIAVGFGVYFPAAGLSLAALAGLCPMVSLQAGGKRAALLTFAASAALCVILGLYGEAGLTYLCLFGLYPCVKELSERQKKRFTVWLCKLLYANAALGLLLGLSLIFLPDFFASEHALWILWLAYNAAFVLYDTVLGRLAPFTARLMKTGGRG